MTKRQVIYERGPFSNCWAILANGSSCSYYCQRKQKFKCRVFLILLIETSINMLRNNYKRFKNAIIDLIPQNWPKIVPTNSLNVMIQLAFLRWVRVWFKAYGSERQEFSHRFRSTVVTSWFGQLFVLLTGDFFRPPSRRVYKLWSSDSDGCRWVRPSLTLDAPSS